MGFHDDRAGFFAAGKMHSLVRPCWRDSGKAAHQPKARQDMHDKTQKTHANPRSQMTDRHGQPP
jgi:hypothetical protein